MSKKERKSRWKWLKVLWWKIDELDTRLAVIEYELEEMKKK